MKGGSPGYFGKVKRGVTKVEKKQRGETRKQTARRLSQRSAHLKSVDLLGKVCKVLKTVPASRRPVWELLGDLGYTDDTSNDDDDDDGGCATSTDDPKTPARGHTALAVPHHPEACGSDEDENEAEANETAESKNDMIVKTGRNSSTIHCLPPKHKKEMLAFVEPGTLSKRTSNTSFSVVSRRKTMIDWTSWSSLRRVGTRLKISRWRPAAILFNFSTGRKMRVCYCIVLPAISCLRACLGPKTDGMGRIIRARWRRFSTSRRMSRAQCQQLSLPSTQHVILLSST